jgi:hypothetical protein
MLQQPSSEAYAKKNSRMSKSNLNEILQSIQSTTNKIRIISRLILKGAHKTDLTETEVADNALVFPTPENQEFHPFPNLYVYRRALLLFFVVTFHELRHLISSSVGF